MLYLLLKIFGLGTISETTEYNSLGKMIKHYKLFKKTCGKKNWINLYVILTVSAIFFY